MYGRWPSVGKNQQRSTPTPRGAMRTTQAHGQQHSRHSCTGQPVASTGTLSSHNRRRSQDRLSTRTWQRYAQYTLTWHTTTPSSTRHTSVDSSKGGLTFSPRSLDPNGPPFHVHYSFAWFHQKLLKERNTQTHSRSTPPSLWRSQPFFAWANLHTPPPR